MKKQEKLPEQRLPDGDTVTMRSVGRLHVNLCLGERDTETEREIQRDRDRDRDKR